MKKILLLFLAGSAHAMDLQIEPSGKGDTPEPTTLKFQPEELAAMLQSTPTEEPTTRSNQTHFVLDEQECRYMNNLIRLWDKTERFKIENIKTRNRVSLSNAATVGLAATGAIGATKLFLQEQTRGITESLLLILLGGGITAGGVYWWIGNEMGVITSFKGSLKRALEEIDDMQNLTSELKENNQLMQDKIGQAMLVIEKVQTAIPTVTGIAKDNVQVAAQVQKLQKDMAGLQALVEKTLLKKSDKELNSLLTQIRQPEKKEQQSTPDKGPCPTIHKCLRRVQAVHEYNKTLPFFSWKKNNFNQLPQEWVKENGFGNLLEKSSSDTES